MRIEYIDPRELIQYVNNARVHPESQIKKLMASIREFGFVVPVMVDENKNILKGHGATVAAIKLELEKIPCIFAEEMSEAQRKAYIIADNRLAEDSKWDKEILTSEMLRLRDDFGIELELTGFERREILVLKLDNIGGYAPEDEEVKLDPVAVSRPGDVWIMGEHRLICGDCTDAAVVDKLLKGIRPHLMVTDPPYGVKYDPTWRKDAGISDSERTGKVLNDDRADWREAWELFPGDVAYIWHGSLHGLTVAESLRANDFVLRSQIIWVKPQLILSRGDIHWQHESCWYAVKHDDEICPDLPGYCPGDYDACWYAVREREVSHWQGSRKISSVWEIDYADQDTNTTHGTQKPVECMRRPILNNSRVNEYVYELFSGSGTTIIAAHSCRRRCLAVELNPLYVDMAVRRWQRFTSLSATLEGDGQTFDKLGRVRRE